MSSLLSRLLNRLKPSVAHQPLVNTIAFAPLMTEARGFAEALVQQLSKDESRKYKGYHYSNKGLRRGLLAAKECISQTDPGYIEITNHVKSDFDKLRFLDDIKQQLITTRNVIPEHICCCLTCFINEHKKQLEIAHSSALLPLNHCNRINDLLSFRRGYINSISEKIKQYLSRDQHLDDPQINTQLVSLIQQASNNYLQFTSLKIRLNPYAFIHQAMANIEQQKSTYNNLPGDDGMYELTGLASAKSWLNYQLADPDLASRYSRNIKELP